jgi:hypothetical protein
VAIGQLFGYFEIAVGATIVARAIVWPPATNPV